MDAPTSLEDEVLEMVEGSATMANLYNISRHVYGDVNITNATYFSYYPHSLHIAAGYILAYLFIFLLCMVGNILVCLIVLGNRRMRTVTNLFILNLAVSDLLVGIFCIPTTLVDNLITGWPFTNIVCKLSGFVQGMSVSASVFTLVAIAVERFRCIVYPLQPKLTLFIAKATIWLIWVLAVAITCPAVLALTVDKVGYHFLVYNDNLNLTYPLYMCYENFANPLMKKAYTAVLFTHIYMVPLAFITVMYGCIGVKLYSTVVSSRAQQEASNHTAPCLARRAGRPVISQKKIKVIKMLIVVALLFMLSWLPLWTLMMMTDYAGLDSEQLDLLSSYFFPFAHWLAFSNSSVNPIIYGYYNENFKRGFQGVCKSRPFCCLFPCWRWDKRAGRNRRGKPAHGGGSNTTRLKDPSPIPNHMVFGVTNRVHNDQNSDPVSLALAPKRPSRMACGVVVHSEPSSAKPPSETSTVVKTGLTGKEQDKVRSLGNAVVQAWDNK
ncbi:neuropeptide FF receptor 1 like 2 [Gadus morhua]|uniref:Neuropeptide FF receptor 1 like 2 n=1 Tax=Gadus morhua TaxID=8049 RepID=A0A8C5B417_GADMO|nr:neuropeptide FF receptor 1-like [Gadus morhua]